MASPAPIPSHSLADGSIDDLPDVMAVMDSAFGDTFGEAWTRSQLAGIMPMAGVSLVLARSSGGRCAGFSLARRVADEAELLLLAVMRGHRRKGVGRMLLDHFLADAREHCVARVHLEVRDGNPAVGIYQAMGFEPVGRRRGYYFGADGRRHDAITLSRAP
jgi:[ribosomal protein S18]-alanine N-acetyltransferase